MDTGLTDQVVLITGASGGIGTALALGFAAEGARLMLLAGRNGEALRAWVAEQGLEDRAVTGAVDVRDPEAVEAEIGRLTGVLGDAPTHAVINAGVWPQAEAPLVDIDEERVRDVFDVNLLGALWTARAFLRGLDREGPAPSLCLIGSTAGRFGEAGHVAYAASKAALRGVTLTLKNEIVALHPAGRVNLVEPGWTATPMAAGAMHDQAQVTRSLSTTPLNLVGRPEDVAGVCVFLASQQAAHVSGQFLGVHGGMEGRRLR